MAAVMLKCKHFAAFAENNDTAGRGRCVLVFLLFACVRSVCVGVGAATALRGAEGERRR